MTDRPLVLGGSGGIGGAVLAELATRGWQITALARDPKRIERRVAGLAGVVVLAGDAEDGPVPQRGRIP